MKPTSTIFVFLLIASGVHAQSDVCKALPSTAQIRGLYLHQPLPKVRAIIPSAHFQTKANGVIEASVSFPPGARRPANLADIQVLKASFIDNALYSIGVVYNRTDIWADVEDYATEVARKLGLPHPAEWKPYGSNERQLLCGDDIVFAGISDGHPFLMFINLDASAKLIRRETEAGFAREELLQAIKDEKRANFKP